MLSPEAKLNLLQISAKYLINNTPNCFVPDAAVVSAELGNSSAEKSLFLHHLGVPPTIGAQILCRPANSAPNSARALSQNPA